MQASVICMSLQRDIVDICLKSTTSRVLTNSKIRLSVCDNEQEGAVACLAVRQRHSRFLASAALRWCIAPSVGLARGHIPPSCLAHNESGCPDDFASVREEPDPSGEILSRRDLPR